MNRKDFDRCLKLAAEVTKPEHVPAKNGSPFSSGRGSRRTVDIHENGVDKPYTAYCRLVSLVKAPDEVTRDPGQLEVEEIIGDTKRRFVVSTALVRFTQP